MGFAELFCFGDDDLILVDKSFWMQVLMVPSSLGDTAQNGLRGAHTFKCPLPCLGEFGCVSWVYCRSGVDKDAVTARKTNDDLHFCAFDAAFTVLSQSRMFVINPHVMITCMRDGQFFSQATALCGSAQLTDFELRSLRFVSILASPGLDRASKEVLVLRVWSHGALCQRP